ncbi:Dolichyldiphosphatase [Giardia muris]|uniref:Dolichyldiphosphatase n=1 Tax=Giardia muris TaxID=5742 RepID=A0A4Z1ST35_GIAMU|nr:Dolichyldiphosphatase [Giardia muris]|eukprot:TNJ28165.1 Dolichyldiphosphatase [Giardia muris]
MNDLVTRLVLLYPIYTGLGIFLWFFFTVLLRRQVSVSLLMLGLVMLGNPVVSTGLKHLIKQSRPCSPEYGMPSAHTMWAFGLFLGVHKRQSSSPSRRYDFISSSLLFTSACIVGYSRVKTRAHTMEQVVCGAILAPVYTMLMTILLNRSGINRLASQLISSLFDAKLVA